MDEAFVVAVKRNDQGLPSLGKAISAEYRGYHHPQASLFFSIEGARQCALRANSEFDGMKPYGVYRVQAELVELIDL